MNIAVQAYSHPGHVANYLRSEFESGYLASAIVDYWREHGHPEVRVWVENQAVAGSVDDRLYVVRSNLVNGKPAA